MNTTFSAPQPIGLSVPFAHASSIRVTKSECAWMGMEEGSEEDDEGQSGDEGQQTAGSEGGGGETFRRKSSFVDDIQIPNNSARVAK